MCYAHELYANTILEAMLHTKAEAMPKTVLSEFSPLSIKFKCVTTIVGLHHITHNYTVLRRITQNCTKLRKITQNCTHLHQITQNHTELHRIIQITQNYTELHRITQNCTELHRITQNYTKLVCKDAANFAHLIFSFSS